MLHTLATWMAYQIMGVPVGAWLALAALAEIQDRLRTSRWKSNTVVQLLLNGTIGRLRAKYAIEPAAPILPSDTAPTEPTRQRSDHGSVTSVILMVIAAVTFAMVVACAGCAHDGDARATALKADAAASDALRTSYSAWRAFDRQHQQPMTAEERASWRTGAQSEIVRAFVDARDAQAAAHALVAAGISVADGRYLDAYSAVVRAYSAVAAALNRHGVRVPAPSIAPAGPTSHLNLDWEPGEDTAPDYRWTVLEDIHLAAELEVA